MAFLLDEDKAIRDLLKGMKVTDQKTVDVGGNATRNVDVWFGQPDQEPRNQSYPYIVIDMIDIAEDFTRSMRGRVKPLYLADPINQVPAGDDPAVPYDPELNDWKIDWPIPVNIDYQITTYSRQPRHDRQILAQLMTTRLPLRFGTLNTGENDSTGTVRRLDILDVSKRDVTEQGKRLFVNAFTVRVSSEIPTDRYNQVYKALQISVTGVTDSDGNTDGSPVLGRSQLTPITPFTYHA
jgi:hypothetical protein